MPECKQIPRNTRYQIAGIEHPKNPRDMHGTIHKLLRQPVHFAICMVCTELQEIEKFSKKQIRNFVNECIALINELSGNRIYYTERCDCILKKEIKFDMRGGEDGEQQKGSANMGKSDINS